MLKSTKVILNTVSIFAVRYFVWDHLSVKLFVLISFDLGNWKLCPWDNLSLSSFVPDIFCLEYFVWDHLSCHHIFICVYIHIYLNDYLYAKNIVSFCVAEIFCINNVTNCCWKYHVYAKGPYENYAREAKEAFRKEIKTKTDRISPEHI